MKIILGDSNDNLFLERDNKTLPLYDLADSRIKGHEYVEIGGIKWATMNVGATGVTDGGMFFAWGETDGFLPSQVTGSSVDKQFSWADYKFSINGGSSNFKKYKTADAYRTLVPGDDPVTANWGGAWRLPTHEESVALGDAVTTEWVTDYQGSGVNGLLLTDKSDSTKQLFFPAAGCGFDGSVSRVGSYGYYWSSSLYESNPAYGWGLVFLGDYVNWESYSYRRYGLCARGVLGSE